MALSVRRPKVVNGDHDAQIVFMAHSLDVSRKGTCRLAMLQNPSLPAALSACTGCLLGACARQTQKASTSAIDSTDR